ncbi:MAG: HWE histidine kinase domain-containing protein [Alteripontixanthobacter sp.]
MTELLPVGTKVDLTNCDREPIHIPGGIQPIGFLIAITADWLISRAANTEQFTGRAPESLLGQPLKTVFTPKALAQLRTRISSLRGPDAMERIMALPLMEDGASYDLAVHFSGNSIVIECEPSQGDDIDVSSFVRNTIGRFAATDGVDALLKEGARQFRALVGFDRVMIYRFADDGSGEVVAQALSSGIDSFMGLHFPATDIPQQARALYVRNTFRIVGDVNREPAPIVQLSGDEPLDLSMALFRAVSPIHLEYLRNMGVRASLSVSIIIEGRFWGLIACHHHSPRMPNFGERSTAELFGRLFSLELERALRAKESDYESGARRISNRLMASAAQDQSLLKDAEWLGDLVSDSIPCDGVGVFIEGETAFSGSRPDPEDFGKILKALNAQAAQQIYHSSRITDFVPGAEEYADRAAGLIAIPISHSPRDYVILFRKEKLQTVRWGGKQEKERTEGNGEIRLSPRKSFDTWTQQVRATAEPFTSTQLKIADALRTTLLEVVLQLSEAAAQEKRRASEQQQLLIGELNHRVRNILALIRALMNQTKREKGSTKDVIKTLDHRVQALANAHDQLTADNWAPADLAGLIETEFSAYIGQDGKRLTLSGPPVAIVPEAFTIMALVIHEMTTNAAKYGALSDSGNVDIGWSLDDAGDLDIEWRESGGPAVQAPERRGFGTTVIETSIPHELGGSAQVDYRTAGLRAHFSIPSRYVDLSSSAPDPGSKIPENMAALSLADRHILLVEDNMIIALDAEDMLTEQGAAHVHLASSIGAAMKIIESEQVDCAMLDFNLGSETSEPIADALIQKGIPFILASGYGGGESIPKKLADIPLVTKPYTEEAINKALLSVLEPA